MSVGCKCLLWENSASGNPPQPNTFSLPAPLPQWPQGKSFAAGIINLGEIEVAEITNFELIWTSKGVSFYRPVNIPIGFRSVGYYCQFNDKPSQGSVIVVRESHSFFPPQDYSSSDEDENQHRRQHAAALVKPLDYTLIWTPDDGNPEAYDGQPAYFWAPQCPEGYQSLGFVVTDKPGKPDVDELRCIRLDLTDKCETCGLMLEITSKSLRVPFRVWKTRPVHRGLEGRGVPVGSFYCSTVLWRIEKQPEIMCLKNVDASLSSMPNLDQINALIGHYGPTMFFHPEEKFLPSSIPWFFENGAQLFKKGEEKGHDIDRKGSNLPAGGSNDGEFWIGLAKKEKKTLMKGNVENTEFYVHVKPALGGTYTDIVMWIFYPFNGPATLKFGPMEISLGKIGEHVGDWEHFTLRISNFSGELRSVYFSQHSRGVWVNACDLEYIEGNRPVVYSARNGHACFPHPGICLQGASKIGVGIRNDCCTSKYFVDSSKKYEIVAVEYLGDKVVEPQWLQFMREWGPTVVYDSKTELDKVLKKLPAKLRCQVTSFCNKFPTELYGEEGPTGPKEKNNWLGDERW